MGIEDIELKDNDLESDFIEVADNDVTTIAETGPKENDTVEGVDVVADGDKGEDRVAEPKKPKRKDPRERINELTRQKYEAEERAAAAEARNAILEEEAAQLVKKTAAATTESFKAKEKELLDKKKAALEDADLVAYDEINEELFNLRLNTNRATTEIAPKDVAPKAVERQDVQAEQVVESIHPAAEKWLNDNKWFDDKNHAHLAKEVLRIETKLLNEGLDYGPDLYKRIDEEIDSLPEFDDVRSRRTENRERSNDPPPRSLVAPPTRGGEPPARPTPGKLTEYDKSTMRTYKLDPNNPKHRETYLQYKRR